MNNLLRNIPFLEYNKFSGFRSLWAMFKSWRNFTARQIFFINSAASEKYQNSLVMDLDKKFLTWVGSIFL